MMRIPNFVAGNFFSLIFHRNPESQEKSRSSINKKIERDDFFSENSINIINIIQIMFFFQIRSLSFNSECLSSRTPMHEESFSSSRCCWRQTKWTPWMTVKWLPWRTCKQNGVLNLDGQALPVVPGMGSPVTRTEMSSNCMFFSSFNSDSKVAS